MMRRTCRLPWETMRTVCLVTALLALSLVRPSAGQSCNPNNIGHVLLHPHFAGTNWSSELASVDLTLPDTVCRLQPRVVSTSAAAGENVTAFFGAGGGLYLMQSQDGCPACLCCRCYVGFFDPVQLDVSSLPLAAGSPVYVIRQTGYTFDNVRFVIAGTNRRVLVVTARGDGSGIDRVDTLTLLGTASQTVRFLGGALNATTGQDTGLWVAGTRGLLRLFPYNGTAWGVERSYDIAATDTVLCVGGGFAGTWSGRMFAWNGTQFVQQSRPTNAPMHFVDAKAAVGDSGVFLLRENNAWTVFRTGVNASLRRVNLTKTGSGSAAEMLDSSWGYHRYVYRDSLTRIASASPAGVGAYLDSLTAFHYTGSSLPVTLTLADADSNYGAPRLRLSDGSTFDGNGIYTLRGARPDAPCSVGVLLMTGNAPTVRLQDANVFFQVSARLGEIDVQCGGCTWTPYTFGVSKNWQFGDSLIITVGSDTLRIVHGNPPSTGIAVREARGGRGISLRTFDRRLAIDVPRDCKPLRISLHDAAGRTVARFEKPAPGIVLRAQDLSAGVLYLRVEYPDGRISMTPIMSTR